MEPGIKKAYSQADRLDIVMARIRLVGMSEGQGKIGQSHSDAVGVFVALDPAYLAFFASALRQSVAMVDDWEYPIRTGFTHDQANALEALLGEIKDQVDL